MEYLRHVKPVWIVVGLVISAGGASAQDLIVESHATGKNFSHYKEVTGKWIDSRIPPSLAKSSAPGLTAPGLCGTRKTLFSGPNVTTTGPATARFLPKLERAGHYYVYATWPRAANATPVRYVVRHAEGFTDAVVAQNGFGAPPYECNAGVWVPLGDFDFVPGDDQYVEVGAEPGIRELDTRWYGQVYADAVRFSSSPLADLGTPLGPEAPPPPQGTELPLQIQHKPLPWESELDPAMTRARSEKKNILVFFHLPFSGGTTSIEQKLLSIPEIRAALDARFVMVRLDFSKSQETANRLGVFRANVITLYNSQGEAAVQLTDDNTPPEFLDALRKL